MSQACKHIKLPAERRFNLFLLFSIIFLGLLTLGAAFNLSMLNMLFSLGLFSGYELTVFNKIGVTSVNNGIMTGNLKNFANNVYEAIFSRDKSALIKASHFLSGIIMFVLGIMFSAYVLQAIGTEVFTAAFMINIILLMTLYIDYRMTNHQQTIS